MATLPTREPDVHRESYGQGRGPLNWMRREWHRRFPTRKQSKRAIFLSLLGLSAVVGCLAGYALVSVTDLPQIEDLERYHPNTTTELLDTRGRLFGSFALEKRVVVQYGDIPPVLRDAILSIEDKTFESNVGINLIRAIGAAVVDVRSHGRRQGASTLTMQLSRNLFLSAEQSYTRKAQEILLALQIERHFTKDQIFTLYCNQIYLGSGTYGFEAGSEHYFSKHLRELTLPEAALLAALPKGPVSYSPVRHPERALKRRNLVLSEMRKDGKISEAAYEQAVQAPLLLKIEAPIATVAPYFVEEVRRQLEQQFGSDQVHGGSGMRVYTTLDLDLQTVAEKSVLDGLAEYERRHGWKGSLKNVVDAGGDLDSYAHPDWVAATATGGYVHALVVEATKRHVLVRVGPRYAELLPADWAWTGGSADRLLRAGDIVYVRIEDAGRGATTMHASLQQDSGAQASLLAIDNANGDILAMVGGRDYNLSQFNRATQAQRQVGSSFKPYVYTAAIEAGAKPTDTIVDAPTSFYTPNGPYTPHNYEPDYKGTMTLTTAFAESRNIPALKLANKVGIRKVIEVAHRFGISETIPAFLPVALGSASLTLNEQVAAYSAFPNDGIRVEPHAIRRVVQSDGLPLKQTGVKPREVISVETARTMMTLLKAVPQFGTAAAAGAALKHPLGGKTGTTNSYTDAWFVGFTPSVTCGTWIGFDNRQTLGEKETGARAALPMWINFMRVAIARTPVEQFPSGDVKRHVEGETEPAADQKATPPSPKTDDMMDDSGDDSADPDAPKTAPAPSKEPVPADEPNAPDDAPSPAGSPAKAAPSAGTAAAPRGTDAVRPGTVVSPVGPYRPYTGDPKAVTPKTPASRTAPPPQ